MSTRIHHPVYEPEGDGERNRWSGLFILGASLVAWACIVLGARWAWEALL